MLKITYPDNLPVSREITVIKELVSKNQVVIVCGETGSGKTTQLPKMLYEMGYADFGIIGHTQPRRVAAKSIARRISEEIRGDDQAQDSNIVGYKVRFQDRTLPETRIKLMTDGILLQEIQSDKLLTKYSAIIIDEAHERSLNIDFILGHIRNILNNRPDLKVIITSATIENEKFAKFFNHAPIINVEGKTFPVDIVYQPFEDDGEVNLNALIHKAIESCFSIEHGNVLIFLPGEREIKDCISFLKKTSLNRYQLLALFSRQNENEQNLVFADHGGLKIVVTTNIAETSVTIPGVKYVVDSGLARVKRYNYRNKVEQLQVEPISQASCKQRAGRAGRISHGMCVRLYSEQDFNLRDKYTTPEVMRSNLANVILRLIGFRLGDPFSFPFLDRPEDKIFNDGFKTLYQLNAINQDNRVTHIGRKLSLIPIDVNLARMLYAAAFEYHSIDEVLVIVSFLAIIDPREFSFDSQAKAREIQHIWEDKDSDFITILNLWNWYKEELLHKKSRRTLNEHLHSHFLNANRMREWHELHGQLKELINNIIRGSGQHRSSLNINEYQTINGKISGNTIKDEVYIQQIRFIHQALLTGLLNNIGQKDLVENYYMGTLGKKFFIHPASNITKPKWIVSASLTQTTKLYARMNAKILPEWLVPLSTHLVKYAYSDARFDKKRGEVVSSQSTLLYGLLINRKNVPFSKINLSLANEIFIKEGIIPNELGKQYNFMQHNQKVLQELDKLESKHRTVFVIIEDELFKFYSGVVPVDIADTKSFDKWCQDNENKLKMNIDKFVEQFDKEDGSIDLYPDFIVSGTQQIKLKYVFDTSRDDDGINAYINLEEVGLVSEDAFLWLVPGLIRDKIAFIIKALPKQIRIALNPVNNFITNFLEHSVIDNNFNQELSSYINQLLSSTIKPQDIEAIKLPAYLMVHYVIIDSKKVIYKSDSLLQIKNELADKLHKIVSKISSNHEILNITTWVPELDNLLQPTSLQINGKEIIGYTALVVKSNMSTTESNRFEPSPSVNLNYVVVEGLDKAVISTRKGLLYLIKLHLSSQLKFIRQKQFNHFKESLLYLSDAYTQKDVFMEDFIDAVLLNILEQIQDPRTHACGRRQSTSPTSSSGRGDWQQTGSLNMNEYSVNLEQIPKSESDFNQLLSLTKSNLGVSLVGLADLIYAIGVNYNQVKRKIKNHAIADSILLQLDDLVFPNFLRFVSFDNLKHFPRYLDAILYRLDKFNGNPDKDIILEREVNEIYEAWYNYVDEQEEKHRPIPREVYNFKYKIEELRVSLFAQELKTAYRVSSKRLWNELESFHSRT